MIPVSVNRVSYNGNGVTTEFSYSFKILNASDIKVMTISNTGIETILTSDYYVDTVASKVYYPGYAPGAEEPLEEQPPILPSGWRLVIYRDVPINQLTALDEHWPFKDIEDIGDKLTIICQQMNDALIRAPKLSESTSLQNVVVPCAANKAFKWNSSGNALELTVDPADVLPLANAALAATEAARDALLLRPGYIAVEADLANIDVVAANTTNINTVATNISNVNNVGSNIAKVVAVANDLSNIDAVKNDLTNIDTVAGDHTHVVSLGSISNDIRTVSVIGSSVTIVAGNSANINTVAGAISNVNAVGGSITAVNGVYSNLTTITAVNGNKTNIDLVAGDKSNIDAVAGDKSNIDAVAGDLANIDAAEGNANTATAQANRAKGIADQLDNTYGWIVFSVAGRMFVDSDGCLKQSGPGSYHEGTVVKNYYTDFSVNNDGSLICDHVSTSENDSITINESGYVVATIDVAA